MRVTINDALDPIVRQLGRIATASTRQDRGNLREATVPMILDSAAHLIKGERVRACWFRSADVPFVRLLAGLLADALASGATEEGLRRLGR
jgi:hypothetical protein